MNALRFSPRRFLSLLKKEAIEIFRDRSILFMGLALPLLMLFIYGYGVSMDMEAVPAAVVLKERTPAALAFTRDLSANKQFAVRTVQGRPQAEALLEKRDIEFILEIPNGFERALTSGRGQVQLTIYGVDSNSAVIFRNYAAGILAQTAAKMILEGRISSSVQNADLPAVTIVPRTWFNDEANSRWYLVPGLLVIVSARRSLRRLPHRSKFCSPNGQLTRSSPTAAFCSALSSPSCSSMNRFAAVSGASSAPAFSLSDGRQLWGFLSRPKPKVSSSQPKRQCSPPLCQP